MKRFFFLFSLLISFSIGQIFAGEVTISPSQALNDGGVDPITIACAKGDGTSDPSISSSQLRLYQAGKGKTTGNTITFTSTNTITKIVFTFANSMTASNGSFSEGTYDSGTSTWTGSVTSLTLTVTGTSSSTRIYITNMVVTYDDGGATPTCAKPTFSPAAGSYEGTQNVTISSTTGATIYYTTDGTTPSTSSSVYSEAIPVSANTTIKAYAVKTDYNDSEVAEAAYTITEGPDVTINLLDDGWGFPTSKVVDETSYTNGNYTIKVAGTTGNGFRTYGTYFMLGQNGAYIELPTFTNPIEKIVVTGNSGGSSKVTWNIFKKGENSDAAVSTAATGCTNDAYTFNIDPVEANVVYRLKVTSAANLQIKAIKIYYGAAPDVATPTISGEQNFTTSTTVTLGCTTDGASIYYTTDGTTPSNTSTAYSAPFTLNSSATVKAIAIKGGKSSSVAEKAFTKIEALTTMDAIFTKATAVGNTATDVYITFNNWVVTGVKGSNAYVTDGTKGLIIYQSSHGFAVGNILSGTIACKVQLYNGSSEITSLTSTTTGLTVTTGGTVTPVELDASGIAALTGVNTGSVIKISGACTTNNSKYYVAGVQLYNTLFAYTAPTAGNNYNVTGVYVQYNSTKEILPRSAADIEEVTSSGAPEAPTFSVAAGEYTSVQTVELSCTTEGATIYYTTDGSTPSASSTEYTAAITVDANMTIKAIAIKDELSSSIASATYTINLPSDPETSYTWDLSTDSYVADPEPTADLIQWTSTYVTMKAEKNGGSTGVNNYIPPTRTSTRFYTSNKITFIPDNSKQITTIVITAASSGYATALKNATWTNATAAASDTEVTITAAGSGNIVCVLGSNTGITSVTVNYEPYVAPATYAVTFATPEHGSLSIANGNNPIASGDEFVAGTELTVSTNPASGYTLNAIKVIETGSNPENDVTSTVLSESTLTVPAYAITVSATFVPTQAPVATLTLSENGTTSSFAGEHHQGDVVTLPLTSSADCVKDFVGWSANASCAVAPEYAPGAEYTLASTSQTLYAVYATVSGSKYVYTALANIASGSEVVVAEGKTVNQALTIWAATNDKGTSAAPAAVVVTADEGVLSTTATNIYWIITKDGDNFSFTPKGGTGKLYCTSTNNGVRVGEGEYNLFSIKDDYLYNNGTSRYIGVQNATDWRCYTSINSTISGQMLAFYKKTPTYSDFATTCVTALADPEFTPAAGTYTEAKNVVITAEEGTIYYTLDGTDPTSASTEYTAPIVLDANGTTTIKAIAISATSQSAVVSATYTINLPLSTIPAIFESATSTQTEVNIKMGNWVVSGVGTDEKTVYVTDNTNGFIIYNSDHGFEVGDILSGTITCNLKKYKGTAELIGVTNSTTGLTVTKGGTVSSTSVAPADLAGVNTGALISLTNWKYDGTNLTNGTISIQPFNTLYAYDEVFVENKYYNVDGIYLQFDSKKEILPRSADDIELIQDAEAPTMTWYVSNSKETEIGASYSIDINDEFAPYFETNSTGAKTYTSSNSAVAEINEATGVLTLKNVAGSTTISCAVAADDDYLADSKSFILTVKNIVVDNVVILVEYNDKWYAMSNAAGETSKSLLAVEVTYSNGKIWNMPVADQAAITWKRSVDGDDVTFQDASNKYLKGDKDGAGLTLVEASTLWNWYEDGGYYRNANNNPRTFFTHEETSEIVFKHYAISNKTASKYSDLPQVVVAVFADGEPTPDYGSYQRSGLTIGNYGTICLPNGGTISGAKLFDLEYYDGANTLYFLEVNGNAMVAGRPYIFLPSGTSIEVTYTDNVNAAAGSFNGLVGSYTQETITSDAGNYILYQNAYYLVNSAAYVGANRAYIHMASVPTTPTQQQQGDAPRRRVAMAVNGEQVATGIDAINASDKPMKVMIDGKLYIIRAGQMYDMTGSKVK